MFKKVLDKSSSICEMERVSEVKNARHKNSHYTKNNEQIILLSL